MKYIVEAKSFVPLQKSVPHVIEICCKFMYFQEAKYLQALDLIRYLTFLNLSSSTNLNLTNKVNVISKCKQLRGHVGKSKK